MYTCTYNLPTSRYRSVQQCTDIDGTWYLIQYPRDHLGIEYHRRKERKKNVPRKPPRPALHSKHLLPTSIQLYLIHHSPFTWARLQGCYYIPVDFTFRTSDLTYITLHYIHSHTIYFYLLTCLFIHSFLPIHLLYPTSKFKSCPSRSLLAYQTLHAHRQREIYTSTHRNSRDTRSNRNTKNT